MTEQPDKFSRARQICDYEEMEDLYRGSQAANEIGATANRVLMQANSQLRERVTELEADQDDPELESLQAKLDAFKADKPDELKDNANDLIPEWMVKHLPALYATEEQSLNDKLIWVKFFDPTGAATWYIAEYDPKEKRAFGHCDLGMGFPEWGYVSITELETCKQGFSGLKSLLIERDLHFYPTTFSEIEG